MIFFFPTIKLRRNEQRKKKDRKKSREGCKKEEKKEGRRGKKSHVINKLSGNTQPGLLFSKSSCRYPCGYHEMF